MQYIDYIPQVSDVEGGERKANVAKVAVAALKVVAAGIAGDGFVGGTHALVHRAISSKAPGLTCSTQLVDIAVGNFKDCLVDDFMI
jgi:hypothetical protein